ncbi:hypothetical protein GTA08_BOTSDO12933 [Neofusicoccum parvum]|uniref:Uncharacterized protein n=1 Tax=Neofusicoccum parvum TaxID=310453 RepID=A0ACB5S742_9PEZI|nr:hypothetical protein GTA08_BOTSDO12933 [Neofusicoccum parvum]
MSFAVREGSSSKTRVSDDEFIVTLVYSDSTIRTYSYTSTPSAKIFNLIHVGTYLTSCLTQTIHLSTSLLLTAGTDGHIAFWPLPSPTTAPSDADPSDPLPLTFISRTRLHQSTIKSLAHIALSHTTTLLLTAGDDNAIAFTLLHQATTDNSDPPDTSTLLIPRAHAATITGAVLLAAPANATEHDTRLFAVTSGSDQRVKVWAIAVSLDRASEGVEALRVTRVGDEGTAVADVSDVVCLAAPSPSEDRTVVVVGVGMEAWKVGTQESKPGRCTS